MNIHAHNAGISIGSDVIESFVLAVWPCTACLMASIKPLCILGSSLASSINLGKVS